MGRLQYQGDLFLSFSLQTSLWGGFKNSLNASRGMMLYDFELFYLFFEEFVLHFIQVLPVLLLSDLHVFSHLQNQLRAVNQRPYKNSHMLHFVPLPSPH